MEGRKHNDRRQRSIPVAVERRSGKDRRQLGERRRQVDPTTCERDYSDEEIAFMKAMDLYKRANRRPFPTWSEVLDDDAYGMLYTDTATGTRADRPEWNKCLADLRPGDTLIIWKIDRRGRNLRDLIEIVTTLEARGVGVKSLTNGIVDTTTAHGKLVFGIFALLARIKGGKYLRPIMQFLMKVPLLGSGLKKMSEAALERSDPELRPRHLSRGRPDDTRDVGPPHRRGGRQARGARGRHRARRVLRVPGVRN